MSITGGDIVKVRDSPIPILPRPADDDLPAPPGNDIRPLSSLSARVIQLSDLQRPSFFDPRCVQDDDLTTDGVDRLIVYVTKREGANPCAINDS